MRKLHSIFVCLSLTIAFNSVIAQRVVSLVPGISTDSIFEVKQNATKIAFDALSGNLFYSTLNGDIYEIVMPAGGAVTDTLRFTATDHGITFLQGLYFKDSTLYVCGSNWYTNTTVGKIVKGILQPNGSRVWIDVVTTSPYPSASSSGDHGFSGLTIDPMGAYIFVSSGARTHLGEVRTNNGAWPGYREVPLTTRIFKFPIATVGLILQNDSAIIDNSGFVFAWGTRNAYDMAWDGDNNLFAIDNVGERDDPEELNWLRQGKNYGYPWTMGGNANPLTNPLYDVNLDPLVNPLNGGYLAGWFAADPNFPPIPPGVTFTEPVRNYGPDADFFRDEITGQVKNASDEGTFITSFTGHRSPLGLVFDRDSLLAAPYRGDGFVLSFMPGGDSAGYTPLSPWGGPSVFVDPSRELTQLKLTYNASIDNFTMTATDIVTGFYLPVDAVKVGTDLYVIEYNGDLWKISFPAYTALSENEVENDVIVYPNPFTGTTQFEFNANAFGLAKLDINDVQGKLMLSQQNIKVQSGKNKINMDLSNLKSGIYFYHFTFNAFTHTGKISKIK